MMRLNKYTRDYTIEGYHILFNLTNEKLLIMSDESFTLIMDNINNLDEGLAKIHPSLYQQLKKDGMIVDNATDETRQLIDAWQQEDIAPKDVKITVNPTLQCNLRCWYCYENHEATKMSDEVRSATERLIDRKLAIDSIERLIISFFGGEPLLYFDQIVAPLIDHAVKACADSGKLLSIGFTTNGVLIKERICEYLKATGASISMQITLDGNREQHNKTRFLPGNRPTYDIIIRNIRMVLSYGFQVNVRLNYTSRNFEGFAEISDEFEDLSPVEKKNLTCDFHKVWQEESLQDVERTVADTHETFLSKGFISSNDALGISTGRCYADYAENVVVNYNGNIYRCTARDFTKATSEGILKEDGTIELNKRGEKRNEIKFGDYVCRECRIFPICHNGCSQDKLESNIIDRCPRGYSDDMKESVARAKAEKKLIDYVLKRTNQM
ncbi:MAG: radical SAM protein [Bacteroides sp.]|nr:radical SAM protein [Bacteroides sp.]